MLVVGNGGAARGAAFALSDAGARSPSWAAIPIASARSPKSAAPKPSAATRSSGRHFDAVVHATPLGMYPNVNESFFNGHIPADIVFDMVYNPMETALVRKAKEQGKTMVPGLDMFIEQAVRQFEIWTGESAPRAGYAESRYRSAGGQIVKITRRKLAEILATAPALASAQTAGDQPD